MLIKKSLAEKIKNRIFTFAVNTTDGSATVKALAEKYFNGEYENLVKDCDRVFAILMGFQWVFAIGAALVLTPFTVTGVDKSIHFHVWLAVFGGGILAMGPIALYLQEPGAVINRYVNVISQGLFSALLIHLMGGRLETHFHVFGSLAFFAFYRDIRVLLTGTLVVAGDHLIRGLFFAESVYGMPDPTNLRWLEHAGWVVFEDCFLAYTCVRSLYEMKVVAFKRAEVEEQKSQVEVIVEERTQELSEERNSMGVILNNIEQGLFTIERSGLIAQQCSQACDDIFSQNIRGHHIVDLFQDQQAVWDDLLEMIFSKAKNIESLLGLFPDKLIHNGKNLRLNYRLTQENNVIKSILCVVSDVTVIERLEALHREESRRNSSLIKVLSNKADFVDVMEMVEDLRTKDFNLEEAKRRLHTLKGSLAFLECRWLADICHRWETELETATDSRSWLLQAYQELKSEIEHFLSANAKILKITTDQHLVQVGLSSFIDALKYVSSFNPDPKIYSAFDELMMVPLQEELGWMSELFVKTGENLGKSLAAIHFDPSDRIPTKVYKNLFKSFVHIARNAADHGIEDDILREESGKTELGTMQIKLYDQGENYEIHFKDNGLGIDIKAITEKLLKNNIPVPGTSKEILDCIFSNGFSTKQVQSEVSGRGIGLDAVRNEARKLNGDAFLINHPGEGLTIVVQFKKFKFSQMSIGKTLLNAA